MPPHTPGSKPQVNYLKGLAIFAVIAVHIVNTVVARFPAYGQMWKNLVLADQLTRFSVPLFLALSGFALAQKYATHPPGFFSFLSGRTLKLIPPYLVWSVIYLLAGQLFFSGSALSGGVPLWQIFFLGKAQYHLYFVPLLFQAYLLFPLLLLLSRRHPYLLLIAAFIIQFFTYVQNTGPGWNDQKQYIQLNSWIFYFVFGLILPNLPRRTKYLGLALAIAGFIWSVKDVYYLLSLGHDLIWSARFTRFPVWLYSTGVILFARHLTGGKVGSTFRRLITNLGSNSYHVYLGHVLVLQFFALLG